MHAELADAEARAAAEAVSREIDRRYELHSQQLFTKSDGEALRADLIKQIAESQRWIIGFVFAGLAALALIQKLL